MSNSIINAVKRLERAGSEHSRTTQKLFEAARQVAKLIKEMVPVGVKLPRGYYVQLVSSNIGSSRFLCRDFSVENDHANGVAFVDGIGGYLHRDFRCWVPGQDRTTVLKFAEDVADGLLDEIAEWLEVRTVEMEEAANKLLKAQK